MIFFGDHVGLFEADGTHAAQLDRLDDLFAVEPAQLVIAFAADAKNLDLFALVYQGIGLLARQPHDRRIERAAQTTFGGADHQQMHLVATGTGKQLGRGIAAGNRRRDRTQHLAHPLGVRTRGFGRSLRATQLRRRDHLHGLGDFLRRLGSGDANAHILEAGHIFSVALSRTASLFLRHARPCVGHPRFRFFPRRKTWMAGTSPAMTEITQTSWRSRQPHP